MLTADEAAAFVAEVTTTLRTAHEQLRAAIGATPPPSGTRPEVAGPATTGDAVVTAVAADRLRTLNEQLLAVPAGFTVNAKLAKQLERRRETIVDGGIDWGQAEALAYASLLEDGIPVRLSGQDTERGTFAAPPPHVPRPLHGRDVRADPAPAGGQRVVRGLQLAALGVRGARLRVRLLRRGARRARPLGGAVRRLRQRRSDRDRPVPRRGPLEVGPDLDG